MPLINSVGVVIGVSGNIVENDNAVAQAGASVVA
jgi:uncharacterized protein GlcG (DUF336 family)